MTGHDPFMAKQHLNMRLGNQSYSRKYDNSIPNRKKSFNKKSKTTTTSWVCINYTNLNEACPKDYFPLPKIDHIVDTTIGQRRLLIN